MLFSRGDIIEFDFNPSLGHEPAGRRPALVVSTDLFNASTSMTLVCPITTRQDNFPLHLDLPDGLETYGTVPLEQVRAFDLAARNPQYIESVNDSDAPEFMDHIREALRSFF
ncbi:MAG: type II toxin-antitoxin system PemK/MazF family toxin [Eggerthellaceae bacterium]|nr:type II toxin-antitoxin system PemK/MazF family toxin [Eggerthellaceae bacterium]